MGIKIVDWHTFYLLKACELLQHLTLQLDDSSLKYPT